MERRRPVAADNLRDQETPVEDERAIDPKLRSATEMILAVPIEDRLRQIEAEARFFGSLRRTDQ
jgi:hypothetical protein